MRVVALPDKLRGTASATEVASAIARGAALGGWACEQIPLADGGEGTLEAFGGANRVTTVSDPLGRDVVAPWQLNGERAVIEMAQASGLALVEVNDPIAASTLGTGQLIAAAVAAGSRRIIVGLGGSATTDGGFGALRALEPLDRLREIELVVACDVTTRFVDTARLFSPQKGATPEQVELLHRRLVRLASHYERRYGIAVGEVPGSGAAGGLAGGLLCAGARLVPGFDLVASELGVEQRVRGADLLVTAEGLLDRHSFDGKVVGAVHRLGTRYRIPVLAVVGRVREETVVPRGMTVVSLVEEFGEGRAVARTEECIERAVASRLMAYR